MKKEYNNYDDYIEFSNNGYELLPEDINGDIILIYQTEILKYLILYVKDTLKEIRYIYDTIKILYELKNINPLDFILTNKYTDKAKLLYDNLEKININHIEDEEIKNTINFCIKFKEIINNPDSEYSKNIYNKLKNLK